MNKPPLCPRCAGQAVVEGVDGRITWWRCWNGHAFPVGVSRLLEPSDEPRGGLRAVKAPE